MKFSDNALKYGPWSISKLTAARECPCKFYLQYIKKEKQEKTTDPRGRIGDAVHRTIELMLHGQSDEFALRKSAIDAKLTTNEAETLLEYKPKIFEFLDRLKTYREKQKVQKEFVELKFGLTQSLKPTKFFAKDVFFRGIWDLVLTLQKPVIIIIDHKSGKPKETPQGEVEAQDPAQLKSYAVAAKHLYPNINDEPLKGIQSAIHYVKAGLIKFEEFISAEQIEEEYVPWLVNHINESVVNITEENPKAQRGWACAFCGYKNTLCPLFNNSD